MEVSLRSDHWVIIRVASLAGINFYSQNKIFDIFSVVSEIFFVQ